MDAFTTKL